MARGGGIDKSSSPWVTILKTGKPIGRGAQGTTMALNDEMVYKESESDCSLSDILNEINFLVRLRHPYLPLCYDILPEAVLRGKGISYRSYVTMERLINLEHILNRTYVHDGKGDFESSYPWLLRVDIIYQLIDVLSFLQENGIIYGDLGVRNLMCRKIETELGFRYDLVLIDFGRYHRIGCGLSSFPQSDKDLIGYAKTGAGASKSRLNPSQGTFSEDDYNLVADAMWSLAMLIMKITVGQEQLKIDLVRGMPFRGPYRYHYDINENIDGHFEQKAYQPYKETLVPLFKKMMGPVSERPCHFSDLLKYRLFTIDTDTADRFGRQEGFVRDIRSLRPPYCDVDNSYWEIFGYVNKHMGGKYRIEGPLYKENGPVSSLAGEYFMRLFDVVVGNAINVNKETSKKVLIAATFCVSCFILAAGTLGRRHETVENAGSSGGLCQKLKEMSGVINSVLKDKNIATKSDKENMTYISGIIPRMIELSHGYTQWWVPYFDDRFHEDGKPRSEMAENLIYSDAAMYKKRVSEIENGEGGDRVFNEESTPRESRCARSRT